MTRSEQRAGCKELTLTNLTALAPAQIQQLYGFGSLRTAHPFTSRPATQCRPGDIKKLSEPSASPGDIAVIFESASVCPVLRNVNLGAADARGEIARLVNRTVRIC